MSTLCNSCSRVFFRGSAELYLSKEWYKETPASSESYPDLLPQTPMAGTANITWHTLHESKQVFEQGLASGCELCRSIADTVPANSSQFRTLFSMGHAAKLKCYQLAIVQSTDPDRAPNPSDALLIDIERYGHEQPLEPMHSAAVAASKSGHTSSSQILHMASLWLSECTTGHAHCTRISKPKLYPTRLLEVSGERVKLIDTAGKDIQGHYFTLSYVWGNPNPPLMLTPEHEDGLRNGMLIDDLECTYRDALVVTRSLKCKYLWIDVFCIRQGKSKESREDWIRESATMDRVYAEALLNISATWASKGNDGCFAKVTEDATAPSIYVHWARIASKKPKCYQLRSRYMSSKQATVLRNFEPTSPVLRRGWIVQERILSPRVLHFAAEGIVWECYKGKATQFSPYLPNELEISERLDPRPGSISAAAAKGAYHDFGYVPEPSDFHSVWSQVIKTSSRTKLTEPNKDKLIALQGISRRIAHILGDNEWYGFLSSKLPYSLCWYTSCRLGWPCDYSNLPENGSFPSWHFVHSNQQWLFFESYPFNTNPLLRIIDDPTDSGRLCCVGSVVPLQVELEAGHPPCQKPVHVLSLSGLTAKANGKRLVAFYRASKKCFNPYTFHVHLDNVIHPTDGKLSWLLLPIFWQTGKQYLALGALKNPWGRDVVRFSGLILQPKLNGELVRVGLLYTDDPHGSDNHVAMLEAIQKAKPRFLMIS